jgi:hypothetical protein
MRSVHVILLSYDCYKKNNLILISGWVNFFNILYSLQNIKQPGSTSAQTDFMSTIIGGLLSMRRSGIAPVQANLIWSAFLLSTHRPHSAFTRNSALQWTDLFVVSSTKIIYYYRPICTATINLI